MANQSSRDPEQWLKWYEEIEAEDEEIIYGEEDAEENETDVIEVQDECTDTEQEADTEEDESDFLETVAAESIGPYFLGKDKKTKWNKIKPPTSRTKAHNLMLKVPGPVGSAKNAKTFIDCFSHFIADTIFDTIVECTNKYIAHIQQNFSRDRDAHMTDICELKAFVGILYLAGCLKSGRQNVLSLWSTDGSGIENIYITMSYNRFRFLCRCIRFDDITTREERRKFDKLAPIRDILERFVLKCQSSVTPSDYLTIDEQLVAFRGRCSFKQYIPSKPNKYGLKVYALVDVKTMYTYKLEMYAGIQPDGAYAVSNRPFDVVKRLVEPLKGTGRNITMDNWFSSIPLALELIKDKLTMIGTLRKNKKEVPLEFTNTRSRPEHSRMFAFHDHCTLVSYIPKKYKNILLISTMHHDDEVDKDSLKPEIILEYNRTKSGVDVVDKMCAHYDVARNSRRWPLTAFFNILNIAGINAICLFSLNNNFIKPTRAIFLKTISAELVRPQILKRIYIQNIPRNIKKRGLILLNIEEPSSSNVAEESAASQVAKKPKAGKGRCYLCPRKADKKTPITCLKCQSWICKGHQKTVCSNCLENKENQIPDDGSD